jgi:hypothetical protein
MREIYEYMDTRAFEMDVWQGKRREEGQDVSAKAS